jgi:tRNA U34 5-methylaminomethyl-2-thiouridine-forming methyltransferase MnmC
LTNDLRPFVTLDGSPTLVEVRPDGYEEKMHHSGGALTESLYIYGHGLERALGWDKPVRVLSVGLGLGYNEWITLAATRARGRLESMVSFEARDDLREGFRRWVLDQAPSAFPFAQTLDAVARLYDLSAEHLLAAARSALKEQRWQLLGKFPEEIANVERMNVVFFDAYSKKMQPELWTESTLIQAFATPRLDRQCVFVTYAATGSLNRALAHLGFKRESRPGFQGKRDSTFALREP